MEVEDGEGDYETLVRMQNRKKRKAGGWQSFGM